MCVKEDKIKEKFESTTHMDCLLGPLPPDEDMLDPGDKAEVEQDLCMPLSWTEEQSH